MPFLLKILVTNLIIIVCARIGTRAPTLGGLIATMPLTTLLVLIWLRLDHPGDHRLLAEFNRGVLWGILPTTLFFLATYCCFKKELPFPVALATGCSVWLAGALVHQLLVK